jgi:flagellar hook assembly protein FlgD
MIRVMMSFEGDMIPSKVAIAANAERSLEIFPNPATLVNGSVSVRYTLATNAYVSLTIYDALGRLVRTLIDGQIVSGEHIARWDGRDFKGNIVITGIYFCRITNSLGITDAKTIVVH